MKKTITSIAKLFLAGALLLGFTNTGQAQTTMYSTNWEGSYDGWTVINDVADSPTWSHRDASAGIEAGNTLSTISEEWMVSPVFDFSDGATYTLKFLRAWADSENGRLDVYFTENFSGAVSTTTWKQMDLNITAGLPLEWNGGANYREYSKVIASASSNVQIAFKYTSTGWSDNGTPEDATDDSNKNRIRIKDLVMTTSGAISVWPLPYSAAWATDLEDWKAISNKHASKEWAYRAAATAFMTDGKTEQDDWLISPAIRCSGSKQKQVSFKAGWNVQPSSNISLYYSTDFTGDQSAATWKEIVLNVIPDNHPFGLGVSKMIALAYIVDVDAPKVYFALKYAAYKPVDDNVNQNEIRVYGFNVEEVTSTSIHDVKSEKLSFYPNPVQDVINIQVEGEADVKIYNIAGQVVKQVSIRSNQLNVADLHAGQYIITVKQSDTVYINRFIKK